MTAETPNRSEWPLYGLPGAEYMKDDPDEVIVAWIDDRGGPREHAEEVRVEEWSARPLRHWLPDAGTVLAWIAESAGEEVFEEGSEAFFEASCDPDVVAAFEAALTVFGDAIGTGWRMAHEQIGEVAPISDGEWHDGKIGDIIEPNVGFQEIADELARGDRAAELVKDAVTVSLIRSGRPETIPHTLNLSLRLGDDDANFMLRFIGGQR